MNGTQDFQQPRGPAILYLAHDVADPAVRTRVMMLQAGGAKVTIAGFRRSESPVSAIEGITPIDLGETRNGDFQQRIGAIASSYWSIKRKLGSVPGQDVIIARNLEMLALSSRVRGAVGGPKTRLVYECLDIHRLLLRDDSIGRGLRSVEAHLGRNIDLLITSSPGFVRNYFKSRSGITAPIEILENKYFEPHPISSTYSPRTDSTNVMPWKIGWFGALRCRRSLETLAAFTRKQSGRFEVVLRGIPSLDILPEFHDVIDAEPYMSFHGRYRNPEELSAIYRGVHFSWAIDLFEEGLNSSWLLPNRLYEGCRFGAIPLAISKTETADYISARSIGISIPELSVSALEVALTKMTPSKLKDLQDAVASQPRNTWACVQEDCDRLIGRLVHSVSDQVQKPPQATTLSTLEG